MRVSRRRGRMGSLFPSEKFEPIAGPGVLTIMKPITFALALLACAGTSLRAEPEIKGTAAELTQYLATIPRTVNLMGEAEVKVAADRAIISVRVVTENKSLQEASRANQDLRAKMLKTLAEKGIPAERIEASKFSSTPKYGVFGDKAKSYRVENVVKITVHDEKEFQAVAGLVDATPEFRHDGIEFEHSDKEGLKKKALTQAIDKAMEKKALYESKLGVKLTAKSFEEGRVVPVTPLAGRRVYGLVNSYTKLSSAPLAESAGDAAVGDSEQLPTSFAELVYRGAVTVEYSVESK